MKRNKYSATKTYTKNTYEEAGNGLDPFTGEVQASAVLESPSKEDNTIVEATPTLTPTPSPIVSATPPKPTPKPAVEVDSPTGGAGELEE